MPGLPVLKAGQVIRVLEKVGFQVARQRGSHFGSGMQTVEW